MRGRATGREQGCDEDVRVADGAHI
jgi:hypothetical protein